MKVAKWITKGDTMRMITPPMIPVNTVELGTVGEARGVLALIEALEDHDDVADTYANVDVPDDVAEALAAE